MSIDTAERTDHLIDSTTQEGSSPNDPAPQRVEAVICPVDKHNCSELYCVSGKGCLLQ